MDKLDIVALLFWALFWVVAAGVSYPMNTICLGIGGLIIAVEMMSLSQRRILWPKNKKLQPAKV